MSRLERFYELFDFSLIVVVAMCAISVFLLIPRNWRLGLSLFGMALVQTVARLTELEPWSSICMMLISVSYVLIIASVLLMGSRRIPLNLWTCGLLASAALVVFYVSFADDGMVAVIIELQWLLLAIAAVLVASTISDQQRLMRVIEAICLGLGAGCIVSAFPLIQDPAAAFGAGFGRFMPYRSNPNQIGTAFATAAVLGMCVWVRAPRSPSRVLCGATCALGFSLVVLTVSRMAMLIVAVGYLAVIPTLIRRPLHAVMIVCVLAVGLWKLMSMVDQASFDRFDQGLDRSHLWELGYRKFAQRPVFGLLGTEGQLANEENAHNAYLSFLCLGGLSLGLPLFGSQLRGLLAAVQVFMKRSRCPFDPVVVAVLGCCSFMHLVSGFANEIIYYPTYSWAFLNVVCIAFFTNQLGMGYMRSLSGRPGSADYSRFKPIGATRALTPATLRRAS